jgi:hypothetical protein
MKKHTLLYLLLLSLFGLMGAAMAQTNTTPTVPGIDPSLFPTGDAAWLALIPPLTAFITWLLGKIPPLPKGILPWITPLLGIGIGYALNYINGAQLSPALTAGAGAVAVFLYEAAKSSLVDKANPDASILTPTPKPPPTDS